jgi:hypothetical protein
MANSTGIDSNLASLPLLTPPSTFSSIDARQKVYLTGDEVTLETFNVITSAFPHLRVHVHKKIEEDGNYTGEVCIGVYEVDEVNIEKNPYTGAIKKATVKTFHQVYSTAQGKESAEEEDGYLNTTNNTDLTITTYNEKYKNIIFYTDTGKVYLNGSSYGGGGDIANGSIGKDKLDTSLQGKINSIEGLLNKTYPLSASLNATTAQYEFDGNSKSVSLSWSSSSEYPGFQESNVRYTLKLGTTIVVNESLDNSTTATLAAATSTNGYASDTYTITAKDPLTGRTKNASKDIVQVAKQYMFTSDEENNASAVFNTALTASSNITTKVVASTSIGYDHTATSGYLWFFVPSKYTLSKILRDNNALQAVTYIDKGTVSRTIGSTTVTYKAYRSEKSQDAMTNILLQVSLK